MYIIFRYIYMYNYIYMDTHTRKTHNAKQLKGEHDIWALDLIGFGHSEKPTISYTQFLWEVTLCCSMLQCVAGSVAVCCRECCMHIHTRMHTHIYTHHTQAHWRITALCEWVNFFTVTHTCTHTLFFAYLHTHVHTHVHRSTHTCW